MCRNQVILIFANNARSKQNKKNLEHLLLDIGKQETCATVQQKILNSRVVGARQSFRILRQITWFPENNRALSNFLWDFVLLNKYYQIIIK